jgi:hypothetical protein
MHSPQETTEQTGQMPTMQIETTKRTAGWDQTSMWQLSWTIILYSDLHVSNSILIILYFRVVFGIQELNVCGMTDGVDDVCRLIIPPILYAVTADRTKDRSETVVLIYVRVGMEVSWFVD